MNTEVFYRYFLFLPLAIYSLNAVVLAAGDPASPPKESVDMQTRLVIIQQLVKVAPNAKAAMIVSFRTDTQQGLRIENGIVTREKVAVAATRLTGEKGLTTLEVRGTFTLEKKCFGDELELGHVNADLKMETRWTGDDNYQRLALLIPKNAAGDQPELRLIAIMQSKSVNILDSAFFGPIESSDYDEIAGLIEAIRSHPSPGAEEVKSFLASKNSWIKLLGEYYYKPVKTPASSTNGTSQP